MNGNRGAKGSVNDRIISYLFRKRYLEYLKKRESYTIEEREKAIEYLKKLKNFDIDINVSILDEEDKCLLEDELVDFAISNIEPNSNKKTLTISDNLNAIDEKTFTVDSDFESTSKEIENFDPINEAYDFDNYDYYEIIEDKTGLAKVKSEDIIEIDNEIDKREDEKAILGELNEFINDSLETLSNIKSELEIIKSDINKQYTQDDLKKLKEKYDKLKEKISNLRKQYDVVKEKYDFEDFDLLESITLVDSIDDFKSKADLEEIELMVDVCKDEIESIEGIVIEDEKSVGVKEDITKRKVELVRRDKNYKKTKEDTKSIKDKSGIILEKTNEGIKKIDELEHSISKIDVEVVKTREYVFRTGQTLGAFLRIIGGILLKPFTRTNLSGISLGNRLINRGLRELRESLIPTEVERVEFIDRYKDVEKEIYSAKESVESTLFLIDDSLNHVNFLKENYKYNLKKYELYIPEYAKLESMLDELEKKLIKNKELIQDMEKTLDNQYERNKQRVYKAQHPRREN